VGAKKIPALFLASLVQQLIVLVHTLLLIVPGLMKAASYAVLFPLVVSDEAGPLAGLEESRRRMQGHRLAAFPALFVVWLPSLFVLLYSLSLGASSGGHASRPAWATEVDTIIAVVAPLLDLAWAFTVLALHAKLRGAHRLRFEPESAGE
jgi:hypothetical protein